MAATRTARELESLILDRLRKSYPGCGSILTVTVSPTDGPGAWMAESIARPDADIPPDCHRAQAAIVHSLQRQYELA
jgi:hypothetical protein